MRGVFLYQQVKGYVCLLSQSVCKFWLSPARVCHVCLLGVDAASRLIQRCLSVNVLFFFVPQHVLAFILRVSLIWALCSNPSSYKLWQAYVMHTSFKLTSNLVSSTDLSYCFSHGTILIVGTAFEKVRTWSVRTVLPVTVQIIYWFLVIARLYTMFNQSS